MSWSFSIISSNIDHDGGTLSVPTDEWLSYGDTAKVMYLSTKNQTSGFLKSLFKQSNPDAIYLNGIFSWFFVLLALKAIRKYGVVKTIIAPRGMLQKHPLSIKPFKKKLYLFYLKRILPQKIYWHVTTEQEHDELAAFVRTQDEVSLIGNVPSFSEQISPKSSFDLQEIVLGTVALISPMKNIHLVLEALKHISSKIRYHIYGPIKDEAYWQQCQQVIEQLPKNVSVSYKGELKPNRVGDVIRSFDFYMQPSQSENFGHTIFEAFNLGVPVIISDQTPWKGLKKLKGGWDVALSEPTNLQEAIGEACATTPQDYKELQKGARSIATNYMKENDLKSAYLRLFSS